MTEKVTNGLFHHFATYLGNGASERNILRTSLHAVLGVTTFLDSAVSHEGYETLPLQSRSRGMRVE
jgi:hypothetical protein